MAGVPLQTLKRAESEASFILGTAGIDAVWVDCRPEETAAVDPCGMPFTETEFPIQVVPTRPAGYQGDAQAFEALGIIHYNPRHHLVRGSERANIAILFPWSPLPKEPPPWMLLDQRNT